MNGAVGGSAVEGEVFNERHVLQTVAHYRDDGIGEVVERVLAEGREMTLERAVAYALGVEEIGSR